MSAGFGYTWRVRMSAPRTSGPEIIGAGVLVATVGDPRRPDQHDHGSTARVLTCAHVVAEALGRDPGDGAPTGEVVLDFPGSATTATFMGRVDAGGWLPVAGDNSGDLALLTFERRLPGEVVPTVLSRGAELSGRRVRAFGHPRAVPGGVWTEGKIIGSGGPAREWVQFDGLGTAGRPTSGGFSGAGVVDDDGAVIGIVVAGDRQRDLKVAWMIPAAVITSAFPVLGPLMSRADTGPKRLPVSDLQRLAAALSEVPVMRDEGSRQLVVDGLRPTISAAVPRQRVRRMDVYSIVDTCLQYEGGLAELMSVVRGFSGDPISLAGVERILVELGI